MATAAKSGRMERNTKEIGSLIRHAAEASSGMSMAIFLKANG